MLPDVTNDHETKLRKSGVFDEYVTYCALGGMLTDDIGNLRTLSVQKFCDTYDVTRMTLSRWKRETQNFAALVEARRDEIAPLARVTNALNKLYVIGVGSLGEGALHHDQRAAVDALKTYLGHHGRLRLPTQPIDHKFDGESWASLVARKRQEAAIEGELVDEPTNTNG